MDKERIAYQEIADKIKGEKPKLSSPRWDSNAFFEQRKKHRGYLFLFSLTTSGVSLLFLILLISFQAYVRMSIPTFEVMSDTGLQIFSVAIFGQVFGVVYIIAHSVWSNDEFKLMR